MLRQFSFASGVRRFTAASLVFSLAIVTIVVGSSSAGDDEYSPKSAEVGAAPDVPQSVVDAHAADVASARGLESSRVVSTDEPGPPPLPVDGRVVPAPSDADRVPLPPLVVPIDGETPTLDVPPDTPRSGGVLEDFDPATAVEVPQLRDEFSTTYQNADGTQSVLLSSIPVHYENEKGEWKPIDNSVVSDGKGALTNSANGWRVTFGVMAPGAGVSITTDDGDLRFVADNSHPVVPVVEPDGISVRYVDVFADTDLVYIVTGNGIEEILVIKSAKGTAAVTFSVEGAQFDVGAAGMTGRGDGIGERVKISAPETFDATGQVIDVDNHVWDCQISGVTDLV